MVFLWGHKSREKPLIAGCAAPLGSKLLAENCCNGLSFTLISHLSLTALLFTANNGQFIRYSPRQMNSIL